MENKAYDFHNEKFKLFSFSDLIPPFDLKKGDIRKIIVSSPIKEFIYDLKEYLEQRKLIDLGPYLIIEIISVKLLDISKKIKENNLIKVVSGSPVVLLMDEKNFWKSEKHSLIKFIKELENLAKKRYSYFLKKFLNKEKEFRYDKSFIVDLKIKKSVSVVVHKKEKSKILIGYRIEFTFLVDKYNKNFIKFLLDCGIGNFNALGFGFLNIKK
jgi:CRISPR-associated endoribonuclease Cas6